MRDVDEFLDQITESMTKLADENERLRSASGLPAAPSIGAPDLADTSRQADEIIERARAEAAKIVQDARAQGRCRGWRRRAATGTDAGRAAVAPFLSQERDFLQQLAALVQSHAESVKGMAKASRAKPAAAPHRPVGRHLAGTGPADAARGTRSSRSPAAPPSDATQPMPRSSSHGTPRLRSSRRRPDDGVADPRGGAATASVSAGDSDDDAGRAKAATGRFGSCSGARSDARRPPMRESRSSSAPRSS